MESPLSSDRWVTNLVTQPHLDGPHITGGVSPPHQDLLCGISLDTSWLCIKISSCLFCSE